MRADGVKYSLIRDDDGHWYVIPADKCDEFDRACRAIEANELGELPAWAVRVNGPSRVVFEAYEVV